MTTYHTIDLPPTPVRDRIIAASDWTEAPGALTSLGADLPGTPEANYRRRIGSWLLWRAGPPSRGDARYLAIDRGDLDRQFTFRVLPDGTGSGAGPDGQRHDRFRSWKESLRDTP